MNHSTTQFITRMKLRELHRQRAKLRAAYQDLDDAVAEASELPVRLSALYEGLRGLTFAGQPLHPEVVNLEVLLHEAASGTASSDILELWLERLEAELAAGRTRSEFVYLFGALLEEWTRGQAGKTELEAEGRHERDRLRTLALADVEPNRHREALDPLFESLSSSLAELAPLLREKSRDQLGAPVSLHELKRVLESLANDIYRPAQLRREARRFATNELLCKELSDALTILASELPTWDWPVEGLATRALWTRNKWRLYLDEDLPTACLLEILGERWVTIFESLIGDRDQMIAERHARLKKLIELNAPDVIVNNERYFLRQAERMVGLGSSEEHDIWGEDLPERGETASPPEYDSVVRTRTTYQRSLVRVHGLNDSCQWP